MHAPREDKQPWYKQFWPWFLISIPAGTIVAAIFTINIAIETSDGLVKDDYYKEGLAVHKDAERVEKAQELGLVGHLSLDPQQNRIELELKQSTVEALQLTLFHPTRSNQDQQVMLQHAGDGRYVGRLAALEPANWKVSIEPQGGAWRISGRLPVGTDSQAAMSELR